MFFEYEYIFGFQLSFQRQYFVVNNSQLDFLIINEISDFLTFRLMNNFKTFIIKIKKFSGILMNFLLKLLFFCNVQIRMWEILTRI